MYRNQPPTPAKSRGDVPVQNITLGAKEVAAMLGIHEKTARKRMSTGEIESYREGQSWRTTRHRVIEYLDRRMKDQERQIAQLRSLQDSNTKTIDVLCRALGVERVL